MLHPRSRVQIAQKAHTSIQVQPEQPGIPCAMVLRLIPCSPRRRIPLASVAGGLKALRNPVGFRKTSAGLTPARVPEPHGFAVRSIAVRRRAALAHRQSPPCENFLRARRCRGHRSPHPTSVTIAIRPSCGRGMAGVVGVIWVEREAEYFSREDWTGFSDLPVGQSHTRSHCDGCAEYRGVLPLPLGEIVTRGPIRGLSRMDQTAFAETTIYSSERRACFASTFALRERRDTLPTYASSSASALACAGGTGIGNFSNCFGKFTGR